MARRNDAHPRRLPSTSHPTVRTPTRDRTPTRSDRPAHCATLRADRRTRPRKPPSQPSNAQVASRKSRASIGSRHATPTHLDRQAARAPRRDTTHRRDRHQQRPPRTTQHPASDRPRAERTRQATIADRQTRIPTPRRPTGRVAGDGVFRRDATPPRRSRTKAYETCCDRTTR